MAQVPKMYYEGISGASQINNNAGSLTTALDAILVTGFPTTSITSLTHSAGVITATKTAHGYANGQVISISGASPDEYNGQVTITSVPDADTFTYAPAVSNPASSPATGTILANTAGGTAGAGWQLVATGTNIRSYRARFGSRMFLGVDDTTTYYARIRGFESQVNAGVGNTGNSGPFPSDGQVSGGLYVQKTDNTAGNRAYRIFVDDRTFYATIQLPIGGFNSWMFGDITSYRAGDAFNCLIIGKASLVANTSGSGLYDLSTSFLAGQTGHYMARNYTQSGGSINVGKMGDRSRHNTTMNGYGTPGSDTLTYPGNVDGGLHIARIVVQESGGIRGHLRGYWQVCHNYTGGAGHLQGSSIGTDSTFNGSGDAAGRSFRFVGVYNNSIWGFDLYEYTNTWD